jgi:hypothetical protein
MTEKEITKEPYAKAFNSLVEIKIRKEYYAMTTQQHYKR